MYRRLLVIGFALLAVFAPAAAQAAPTKQVSASLDASCGNGQTIVGAHFKITRIDSPPDTITVNTTTSALDVNRSSFAGGVATYDIAPDAQLQSAFADVPQSWSGTFRLASVDCEDVNAPGLSATTSQCGQPLELTVNVTNHNDLTVVFTVTVGSAQQQVRVPGGQSGEATFASLGKGIYTVKATGDDGASGSITTVLSPCGEQATASPSASDSPSDSPSPTPSPSDTSAAPTPSDIGGDGIVVQPSDSSNQLQYHNSAWVYIILAIGIVAVLGGGGVAVWVLRRKGHDTA